MSKVDLTAQELFLRLGTTMQSRRVKADALFRRLRMGRGDSVLASPPTIEQPKPANIPSIAELTLNKSDENGA